MARIHISKKLFHMILTFNDEKDVINIFTKLPMSKLDRAII